jgi:PPOX class probable F420-dependent enzyme
MYRPKTVLAALVYRLAMELAEATEFVRHHHRAVLATTRRGGGMQLSPVVATVDSQGDVVISTRERSAKVHNLRRNPTASLCVTTDGFFGSWVQLDGIVTIHALPEAMELLVDYYRSISGEHPDWNAYRVAMDAEQRVLLVLKVTRAGPATS